MSASRIVSISCLSLRGGDPVRYRTEIAMCLDMTPQQMYQAVLAIRQHVSAETWHEWTLRIAEEFAS